MFTAYAAGSALVLISLALLAAGTATELARSLRAIAPYASRIAGALLALSGLYLLYYWRPQLLGSARPSAGGLSALSAYASIWMSSHQFAVVLVAGVVIAGTVATTILASRPRTPGTPQPRTTTEGNRTP